MLTFTDFAKRWEAWGIPTVISWLAPWYEKLFAFPLISPYWQPQLNLFCMAAGFIAGLIAFALFLRRPKKVMKGWLYRVLMLLFVTLLACLVLKLTVGVTFFPGARNQWVVWAGWIIAYVSIFACLSTALVLAMLQLPASRKRPAPEHRPLAAGRAPLMLRDSFRERGRSTRHEVFRANDDRRSGRSNCLA